MPQKMFIQADDQELIDHVRGVWRHFQLQLDLPLIDLQHVWLIALILNLERAWEQQKDLRPDDLNNESTTVYLGALHAAIDYSQEHFAIEEKLFSELGYGKLEEHLKSHNRFTQEIQSYAKEYEMGTQQMAPRLLHNLKQWFFRHVVQDDREYIDYFIQNIPEYKEICSKKLGELADSIDPIQRQFYRSVVILNRPQSSLPQAEIIEAVKQIWDQYKLSIQIPLIDMQHLRLLQIVVELNHGLQNEHQNRQQFFSATLASAIDYIKEHFSTEEAIMKNFQYPELEEHSRQHRAFVQFIMQRNEQHKQGDEESISGLLHDLREWLLSHIAIEDKKLMFFSRENRTAVLQYTHQLVENNKDLLKQSQIDMYRVIVKGMSLPS